MRIGKLKIKGKLALAPMAEITGLGFRLLCKKHGASLVFTEMINAEGLVRGNPRTLELCRTKDAEKPVGFQIFGDNPARMAQAAKQLEEKADLIDINAGCPAKHVTRTGAGSALLENPELLVKIVEKVSGAVDLPVSVKIRAPPKTGARELAIRLEKAGASMLTVHPRRAAQGYGGKADWALIKEAKDALGIPVIGNGDVGTEEDAKRMLEETGCDMVMIGRAARNDPMIFERANHYLKTGEKLPGASKEEKTALIWEYQRISETTDLKRLKAMALYLTKGLEDAKILRAEIGKTKSRQELEDTLLFRK